MKGEIWHKCEVPYTRYEVSNLGRVRNARTGRVLRPWDNGRGYLQVYLWYKGKIVQYVHNLVATAFVEGWREGLQVNHKNGVKTDNRAENLEWVTSSENRQHACDVLLVSVKPVALLDERGHLQWLFNSAQACNRAMGGNVCESLRVKQRYHGFRPLYISVPMYREIVHLVSVQHYTLHSAWVEANTNLFLRSEDHEYCKD
ncbi:MAG: NUMOD4 motif-containing HNH endonuclease [Alloprevotella sp.]|nr:NUMOD4 motif-containing HNH endonuclease [Alloprevotella sp.]